MPYSHVKLVAAELDSVGLSDGCLLALNTALDEPIRQEGCERVGKIFPNENGIG